MSDTSEKARWEFELIELADKDKSVMDLVRNLKMKRRTRADILKRINKKYGSADKTYTLYQLDALILLMRSFRLNGSTDERQTRI
jgi:NhaP-type Na+/H+ and K+/H+ antiporter